MPRLWKATIEAHRNEVRDAILDATAELVAEHGLLAVTMARTAEKAGIGRATLYKYFPDVGSLLRAWHERQVTGHLAHLADLREGAGSAGERLRAVLASYALLLRRSGSHHDTEVVASLHRGGHVGDATRKLHVMLRDLLAEAAGAGDVRNDVAPDELAGYCLHALAAARTAESEDAVRRLVAVTAAGLRPGS